MEEISTYRRAIGGDPYKVGDLIMPHSKTSSIALVVDIKQNVVTCICEMKEVSKYKVAWSSWGVRYTKKGFY